jgi:transcription elongation GreA/GreB family factor
VVRRSSEDCLSVQISPEFLKRVFRPDFVEVRECCFEDDGDVDKWNPVAQKVLLNRLATSSAKELLGMSRAFVKEQDVNSLEDLPDRQISEFPNDVTLNGMAQIEDALAAAREGYALAQASSDPASIAAAGREVRYWSSRRARARVLPSPVDISEVRFGTTVTIVRDDGREQTLRIVGEDEADPAKGSISHASPLARSMFGKGVGDVVKAGHDDAEITFIR